MSPSWEEKEREAILAEEKTLRQQIRSFVIRREVLAVKAVMYPGDETITDRRSFVNAVRDRILESPENKAATCKSCNHSSLFHCPTNCLNELILDHVKKLRYDVMDLPTSESVLDADEQLMRMVNRKTLTPEEFDFLLQDRVRRNHFDEAALERMVDNVLEIQKDNPRFIQDREYLIWRARKVAGKAS